MVLRLGIYEVESPKFIQTATAQISYKSPLPTPASSHTIRPFSWTVLMKSWHLMQRNKRQSNSQKDVKNGASCLKKRWLLEENQDIHDAMQFMKSTLLFTSNDKHSFTARFCPELVVVLNGKIQKLSWPFSQGLLLRTPHSHLSLNSSLRLKRP